MKNHAKPQLVSASAAGVCQRQIGQHPSAGAATSRREFLGRAAVAAGVVAAPWIPMMAAETQVVLEADERQKVEAAVPSQAIVPPRKPRKLLIFDGNVNYGGHRSIPTANHAFTVMGLKTGAFSTVISREPSVFKPESLKKFDAVFLNNTVGNLFEDPDLRQSLVDFVYGGGGLMGVHGTSVAFTRWPGAIEDWPEFGLMLGARGANHRDSTEHVFIKLDDAAHPLNQPFGGKGFEYRDEFFRFREVYSRKKCRVLFSIDTAQTDANPGQPRGNVFRQDNDYALAWVRQYGRGRVFYCTIAHNPYVFWDPTMLRFYFAVAQFALGDLAAPTTPSGRLTPPLRAQEQLGWRLGLASSALHTKTLFEAVDQAAELGLLFIGASSLQEIGRGLPKKFDPQLNPDELRQIRLKLDAAGTRLVTYRVPTMPSDETGLRRLFEFSRRMGVETLIAEPPPKSFDAVERLCEEHDINLALPSLEEASSPGAAPRVRLPREILQICQNRSKRIGACGDMAAWMRAGLAPIEAIGLLRDRLMTLQICDLHLASINGREVPCGVGVGNTGNLLKVIHKLGLKPAMFGVEQPGDSPSSRNVLAENIKFFNQASCELAKGDK